MTEEERLNLLESLPSKQKDPNAVDDLPYLFPEATPLNVGGRVYKLYPFPLYKINLLIKANEAFVSFDKTIEWLGEVLGETDLQHLTDNLTVANLDEIVAIVNKINKPPPSAFDKETSDEPFGVGFRWNVFMLMRTQDLGMSFEEVRNLTLPQLLIFRLCLRELDDAHRAKENQQAAQQQLNMRVLGRPSGRR